MTVATPGLIVRLIHRQRLTLSDEKACQAELAAAFEGAGLAFERERRLGAKDIVDFLFEGGVALEVKIKGGRRAIHDQCARYCGHDAVSELILATGVATGFPPEINGKPCYVASLGRGLL